MSVNEIYEKSDKNKKSPGQWLQSKDVKALTDELESKPEKNDDGEWCFDELLSLHYFYYINPKLIKQTATSSSDDDLKDVSKECIKEFISFISGESIGKISKFANPQDIFDSLPQDIKMQYKSFAYQFKTKMLSERQSESRARDYALKNIISTLRFNVDTQEKLFQNEKCIITFRKTRYIDA